MMSNFSFSHNDFKSCLVLIRRNEYLWSKGLTLSKKITTLTTLQDNSLKNSMGKGENTRYTAFSLINAPPPGRYISKRGGTYYGTTICVS